MSDNDYIMFSELLDKGLLLAEKKMLEEKALRGQEVIVCTEDDTIVHIPASQVISDNEIFQN